MKHAAGKHLSTVAYSTRTPVTSHHRVVHRCSAILPTGAESQQGRCQMVRQLTRATLLTAICGLLAGACAQSPTVSEALSVPPHNARMSQSQQEQQGTQTVESATASADSTALTDGERRG